MFTGIGDNDLFPIYRFRNIFSLSRGFSQQDIFNFCNANAKFEMDEVSYKNKRKALNFNNLPKIV